MYQRSWSRVILVVVLLMVLVGYFTMVATSVQLVTIKAFGHPGQTEMIKAPLAPSPHPVPLANPSS